MFCFHSISPSVHVFTGHSFIPNFLFVVFVCQNCLSECVVYSFDISVNFPSLTKVEKSSFDVR